ncbi:MAG: hypothetical protein EBZ50_15600, partial [Alphaproteobacteria bacterium]|nr:hypothetical protein [Alphaproteobacteria bacterium]
MRGLERLLWSQPGPAISGRPPVPQPIGEAVSPTKTDALAPDTLAKVPAITLGFWIIKILATTFGETAGDAVSMSWLGETTPAAPTSFWQSGYLIGTG